ncbi:hypothetical protein FHW88_005237 [Mucilaginibacter sp. SG538B]|uniref:hypothetical protein n=1 Tax=Mucilaginibacter sp. SG538B TaxID=2587021 RepID=UPI00159E11B4|nr:hypothetical protein [Mucilaginibacter sp. SG538B]NVM66919.1 hypothetical protein [Mucilaginibacter sp. SG538B]
MSWIKFTLWLIGIYSAYYSSLIFWDSRNAKKGTRAQDGDELTFAENIAPVSTDDTDTPDLLKVPPSPVVSSGGVSIRQLFSLAQQEAIEFTRPVSFS